MVEIDGSQKSGSGTFVRDAIPYAVLLGQGVRLVNIRARRDRPGLRPQHLGVVQACAQWSRARIRGAAKGSSEIEFVPQQRPEGGELRWDIGTSGSATLFVLAMIPLFLYARQPTRLHITGGLFQDHAPTPFHLVHCLFRQLSRMGAQVQLHIQRPGYVPSGGGELILEIQPLRLPLQPIRLSDQGKFQTIHGIALASHLQERRVSHRMAEEAIRILRAKNMNCHITTLYDEPRRPAFGKPALQPGAALCLWAESDTGAVLGADMAGAPRRASEWIGRNTARHLLQDIQQGATTDRYLADQLIPFAALAEGESVYRIPEWTEHVESRLWLAETLLGARWDYDHQRLRIRGMGYWPGSVSGV